MVWGFLKRGIAPFAGETSAKALTLALNAPSVSGRVGVLDLGSANESNFNFYNKIAKKISFEDLAARIEKGDADLDSDEIIPNGVKYDTIICWDVFNYLTASQAERLVNKIRNASLLGTRVVVSIVNRPQMAEAPSNFKIVEESKILCEPRTYKMVVAPRYSPRAIARWFEGFEIIHSCLQRYGVEEYVLQFVGSKSPLRTETKAA